MLTILMLSMLLFPGFALALHETVRSARLKREGREMMIHRSWSKHRRLP